MQQQRVAGLTRIIEAIDKPLGFYVLALLIVESFLTVGLTLSELGGGAQERGMWAGVGLFVFVVMVVSIIVWNKPTNLTFSELGSLVEMGRASYGTDSQEVTPDALPSGVAGPRDS